MARPNFILFITDQQRADYLGCYGHPVLKTPNIDRIAAAGVRFDRFYVATPICMPNRSTMMTGRMPSVHGVRHNGISLSQDANTFVDLMRVQGYRTALIGKSHFQNFTDVPAFYGRTPAAPGRQAAPDSFSEARKPEAAAHRYDQELPGNWLRGPDFPMSEPYYGFQEVKLCTRHGDRVGGHYYHWLEAQHPNAQRLRGPDHALPHDAVCPQAWRTAVPEELYPTSYVADQAIASLRGNAAAGAGAPFFMQVSFPDPHHPFTPPGKYWEMYRPEDMVLPKSFRAADAKKQPHVAWLQQQLSEGKASRNSPACFAVTEREAREAMALTCGMIAMIDDAIGRVLAELKTLGLAESTVIAFTTDHGDFMGDHQIMLKGPLHFRGLVRVPFIWADPQSKARGVRSGLTGTLDMARSFLERAGLEPYNGIQGRSLLPLIDDPQLRDRDAILIEEDGQRTSYGFSRPVRCRTLITERHRLTLYEGAEWGELYDLGSDPDELENLWFDPGRAALKGELALRLAYAEMAVADRSPLPTAQG
jgi:arylsulfatase A-like enzyme